jgi:L-aminopeptidase/D-esterase-like protein
MAPRKHFDAITDVPGIKAGHWTDRRAATGCTVVLCEQGAVPGVDVRGGAPGTIGTDMMRPGMLVQEVHAIVLSGGSAFGLATAQGVTRWCEEHGVGLQFGGRRIPIVAGAILFDLNLGSSEIRPDAASGYAAAGAATSGRVAEGSVGAGTGATVAKVARRGLLKGGIGTASEAFGQGFVVGAIVAVNAVGDVMDEYGGVLAGPRSDDGAFIDTIEMLRHGRQPVIEGNTTIGVVATNASLTKEQTNRLASVAHDGLARAVRPAHTLGDGDTLFAVATGEHAVTPEDLLALEVFACLSVERAIRKGVLAATSLAGVPSVKEWMKRSDKTP